MELQAERAASGDRAAAADAANRLQGELDRARAEARRLQTALQAQLAQLAADRDQIRQENDRLRMALADAQEVVDRRVGLDRQLTRLQADFRQAQAENAEITGNLGVARQHLAAASAEARRGVRDVRQERVRSAMLTVSAINMTERMIRSAAALADRARGNLAGLPA